MRQAGGGVKICGKKHIWNEGCQTAVQIDGQLSSANISGTYARCTRRTCWWLKKSFPLYCLYQRMPPRVHERLNGSRRTSTQVAFAAEHELFLPTWTTPPPPTPPFLGQKINFPNIAQKWRGFPPWTLCVIVFALVRKAGEHRRQLADEVSKQALRATSKET